MNIYDFVNSFYEWSEDNLDLLNYKNSRQNIEIMFLDLLKFKQVESFFLWLKSLDIFYNDGSFYFPTDKRPYKLNTVINKLHADNLMDEYTSNLLLTRIGIFISYLQHKKNYTFREYKGEFALYVYPEINSCMASNKHGIKCISPTLLNLLLNKDKCSLVGIYKGLEMVGRFLKWNINGKTYVDKIYPSNEGVHILITKDLAKKNNWILRTDNGNKGYWPVNEKVLIKKFKEIPLPYFDSFDISHYPSLSNNIYTFSHKIKAFRMNHVIKYLQEQISDSKIVEEELRFKSSTVDELDETMIYLGNKYKQLNSTLPIIEFNKLNFENLKKCL